MIFFKSCCLLFLYLSFGHGKSDEYFILKNRHSDLVIDLKNDWLVLANSTGSDTQLWKLEPARRGLYYIINKHKGKALDYDTTSSVSKHCRLPVTKRTRVDRNNGCPVYNVNPEGRITNIGYCQQWYVQFGGIIVNACDNFGVSILDNEYIPGTYLRTDGINGGEHQKFDFVY